MPFRPEKRQTYILMKKTNKPYLVFHWLRSIVWGEMIWENGYIWGKKIEYRGVNVRRNAPEMKTNLYLNLKEDKKKKKSEIDAGNETNQRLGKWDSETELEKINLFLFVFSTSQFFILRHCSIKQHLLTGFFGAQKSRHMNKTLLMTEVHTQMHTHIYKHTTFSPEYL